MKDKRMRRVLAVLLALAFTGCTGFVGFQLYQYHLGNMIYNEAQLLVELPAFEWGSEPDELPEKPADAPSVSAPAESETKPPSQAQPSQSASEPQDPAQPPDEGESPEKPAEDPYAAALNNMDFSVLQQVNEDVIGWIIIPNTQLSYPLLQGEDNQTYLYRTWKKTWGSVGSIFLECQSDRDLSAFNTIVYGHRMRNGSMFGSLRNYSKASYWEKNPSVYITDGSGTHIYDIYSAYEAPLDGPTFWVEIAQQEHKQKFIQYTVDNSVLDTGIVPTQGDRILTMSTCTGNGYATRWVVHAVKRTADADTT